MLNIGLIGAGRIAHVHAQSLHKVAGAKLVAVADVIYDRALEFANKYGVEASGIDALLENKEIDGVIICSPTYAHADQVLKAAAARKHIFCEKAIAVELREADQMIAAAKRAGVIFMVGHVLRFMPEYLTARELIESGTIGKPLTIYTARFTNLGGGSWQGWFLDPKRGLAVLDVYIHDLDYITWILGKGKTVVSKGWRGPTGAWVHISSTIEYPDGQWASAEGGCAVPPCFPFTMFLRVICEEGALVFNFEGTSYASPREKKLILYKKGKRLPEYPAVSTEDPYEAQMRYFVECVRKGQEPQRGRAEDARTALEIALAARRSLELGEAVELSL